MTWRSPLPPTFPDLASLDLFATTVRAGSLSAAAAAHGISQPSASSRIRGLEQRLGVVLLERSPTGSHPTAHGALVAGWVDAMLRAADDLASGVASLRAASHQPLRVVASYTVAEFLLPRWLTAWRQRHGSAAVEMSVMNSTAVIEAVRSGRASIGFIESPASTRGLRSQTVGADELVLVVPPNHPWARRRRPLTPQQLAATSLVMREPGSGTRDSLAAALADVGLQTPPPVAELGSTTAVREAAAGGLAPAVLSRLAVGADLAAARLVEVPVAGLDLTRQLRAVWSPQHPPSAVERDLIDIAG